MKKIYTILMTLVLLAAALPLQAQTTVYYLDSDNDKQKAESASELTSVSSGSTGKEISGYWYATGAVEVKAPLIVSGEATLILCDGASVEAMGCIVVEDNATLTICVGATDSASTIKGTGKLLVTDDYNATADGVPGVNSDGSGNHANDGDNARIGSREDKQCGTINICGGNVEAYSTYTGSNVNGADIGSGQGGWGGTINIYDGTVNCYGAQVKMECNMQAACIGSGYEATSDAPVIINIYSGKVTAIGAKSTAQTSGVGSTYYDPKNYGYGAAIGLGSACKATNNKINISGGTIKAVSAQGSESYGAGIGAGDNCGSASVSVKISGGNISAYSNEGSETHNYAAGIGGGDDGGCDSIVISGSAKVEAYSVKGASSFDYVHAAGMGNGKSSTDCKYIGIVGDQAEVTAVGKWAMYADKVKIDAINTETCEARFQAGDQLTDLDYVEVGANLDVTTVAKDRQAATVKFQLQTKTIYYKEADGSVSSCEAKPLNVTHGANYYEITGFYYVPLATDTIRYKAPIHVVDSATFILLDGSKIHAMGCIVVEDNAKLTITTGNTNNTIAGSGYLAVSDGYNAKVDGTPDSDGKCANDGDNARIGSREGKKCGTIIINNGTVDIHSAYASPGLFLPLGMYGADIWGADIGSGYEGSDGTIIINGGKVICKGASEYTNSSAPVMCGACIGSGKASTGTMSITINGGYVETGTPFYCGYIGDYRYGYGEGAGIGTGSKAEGPAKIVINGGEVLARAGIHSKKYIYGAGIGTGRDYRSTDNTTVTINGGKVTAYASYVDVDECEPKCYAAGIGAGEGWDDDYGKVDVTITGGTVEAYGSNYQSYGSGIGGGEDGGCGNIVIEGTANVKAGCTTTDISDFDDRIFAPGIGDGEADAGGHLYIYGDFCTVETWGLNGIAKHLDDNESEFSRQFSAWAGPTKYSTLIVNSGDEAYQKDNDNSPQKFTSGEYVHYGASKWRKISFNSNLTNIYYTDAKGEVAGPVKAHKYSTDYAFEQVTTLGESTKPDSAIYYYVPSTIEVSGLRPRVSGNVVFVVSDKNSLILNRGITVEGDSTLTITTGGESSDFSGSGFVYAQIPKGAGSDYYYNAAIGSCGVSEGSYANSCGNIIVNDGEVLAQAYGYGAGIGSGQYATAGGSITINDGTVMATSLTDDALGAGIGGGGHCTNPDITINGGTVNAYSAYSGNGYGAGIGAGYNAAAGNITINGGSVKAKATYDGKNNYGAGIGGGFSLDSQAPLSGGTLTINGDSADVIAEGLQSIVVETANAVGKDMHAVVEYGSSESDKAEYAAKPLNLLAFDEDNKSVSNYKYAHVYFDLRSIDVTIGSLGYATLYYGNYALEVPEGVKAWTGKVNDDDKTFAEIDTYENGSEKNVIPKGTAVVLYGEPNTYSFPISSTDATATEGNMLVGTDTAATIEADADGYIYILSYETTENDGDIVGFYFQEKSGKSVTLSAHKAALKSNDTNAGTRVLFFNGATTGVSQVTGHRSQVTNIFDLQGRRLNRLQKGVNIVGGRKVIVK